MNTTQFVSLIRPGDLSPQQAKSARGLANSKRRMMRGPLGLPVSAFAPFPVAVASSVAAATAQEQEQEQQQDSGNVAPTADQFTVQRKEGANWLHVSDPADRARDLEAAAEVMSKANPSQQYRIAKPGAKRAVIAYNAR